MWTALLGVVLMGAPEPLTINPNFWSRDDRAGDCRWDATQNRDGRPSLRVTHTGTQDWAVNLGPPIPVTETLALHLQGDLRLSGTGDAALSFVVYQGETARQWAAGSVALRAATAWQTSTAKTLVGAGVTRVQPRLVGNGTVDLWLGPVTLTRRAVPTLGAAALAPITLKNDALIVVLDPKTLAAQVTDRRTGQRWQQRPAANGLVPSTIRRETRAVTVQAVDQDGESRVTVRVELDVTRPELKWRIEGKGPMGEDRSIPGAWVTTPASQHVVPMNMGIGFRADDPVMKGQWLVGYGGHGLSMAFYGQVDGAGGVLNIIDDPDDFLLRIDRENGRLEARPTWQAQRGQYGYPRRLRALFLPKADVTALALAYRQDAKARGNVVTLAQKAKKNPNVMRVARAVNLWNWTGDKLTLAKAVYDAGFRNVLWSGGGSPELLSAVKRMGFIPSRYDIYQDVMDPARLKDLPWIHPDWATSMWPDHLVTNAAGDLTKGWVVQDKQGKDVPCAVACDTEVLDLARERISGELKTHPFEARFIDTTTASEYRECYDLRHPMTRSDSKRARMKLLQLVTDLGLVTGSETGHEASVPHLVFYEGMMSLGPYRVPDAGTNPPRIVDELPEDVLTFQLGPKYRLPLWQLVYGDCTVSSWYWGDFSNKHLGTWDQRDRWNMLYGTPPLYFTDPENFAAHRARFIQSYRDTMRVVPLAAGQPMTAFRVLTADRTVQQTQWANGLLVTVNFGAKPFKDAGGTIAGGGIRVTPPKANR